MNTLSGIGTGFVGIFIPIYLLELNYSFFTVVAWLAIHHLSLMGGAFLAVRVSNIIGLVRCWYVRILLVAVLFGGLVLLPEYSSLLFFLALISGTEAAFFWIPYNILTVRKTEAATMGSSLAFMSNVGSIFGMAVPIIAAVLIVSYGYAFLFAIALMFILVSIISVLPLRSEKTDFQFKAQEIAKVVRVNRHFIIPEIIDNLGQDAQVIWILFIFITALSVVDIGILGVFVGIVGLAITHITGALIDTWDKKTVVRLGAAGTTVMWIASYLVAIWAPTPLLLYLVTVLRGFILGIFVAAYGAIMFNRARGADAQFLVLREVPTILGRIILFGTTLVLISIGQFELIFLVVAIISIYFWFNNLDSLTKQLPPETHWF